MDKCCEKWKHGIYSYTFCPECGERLYEKTNKIEKIEYKEELPVVSLLYVVDKINEIIEVING